MKTKDLNKIETFDQACQYLNIDPKLFDMFPKIILTKEEMNTINNGWKPSFASINDAEDFRSKADSLVFQLEGLINLIPYKGDNTIDSQKVCLINKLKELSSAINGVENSDLEV